MLIFIIILDLIGYLKHALLASVKAGTQCGDSVVWTLLRRLAPDDVMAQTEIPQLAWV